MFPATQTTPTPTGAAAPSLADIVHEQTQGGRLIVDFLAQAMLGDLPDFKPHHRLQASDRLIKLDASPEFAGMVREQTRGGDLISQFLISAVTGRLPDFQPCHRMEATRQLAIINPKMARALAEDNTPRRSRDHDRRSREGAPLPTGAVGAAVDAAAQQLADIIQQETNDGRDIARFFIDVMQGTRTGFNQHFRFSAAEVLINRGYDVVAALCPDPAAHAPKPQPAPYRDTDAHTGAVGADPVPETTWKWKSEWTHFEYPEDRTYDFSIYGEDEFDRDTYGHKALVHIFGDDETKSAANQAVLDYKVDQIEAQRAAVHSDHDTCQPYDPCPSCRVPDPPDDDSFGLHTYGYNALVYIYSDKPTARVGYMGAMDHKEKQRLALIAAADAHDPVDQDSGSHANGPDPPDPPPKPPKPSPLAYF